MDPKTLQAFCLEGDKRPHVSRPWSHGDYTYALDGSIMIRVPKIEGFEKDGGALYPDPECKGIPWDHDNITDWEDLPMVSKSDLPDCKSCDGCGMVFICKECDGDGTAIAYTDFNEYEVKCKSCNGRGSYKGGDPCHVCHGYGKDLSHPIPLGGHHIKAQYIRLIQTLANPKISAFESNNEDNVYKREPFRFKFDGGCGIVMPWAV